jgi:hypothetical protein
VFQDIICRKKAKILQIEPNAIYRKYKEPAHMSLIDHPISQPSPDISSIWASIIAAEVKKLQPGQCRLCVKIVFLCWCRLFSDDFYCNGILVLGLTCVEFFMSIIFILTLADGLCSAWFLYPILCWCRCPEIRNSYTDGGDRLCGLLVRVSGYRSRGPGYDSRSYQNF